MVFERRERSEATILEVTQGAIPDSQIDVWRDTATADVVTLSIGGNDLGFADIIDGCLIRFSLGLSPNCTQAITTGRDKIQNGTLQSFIETAMVQIINKFTRDDLKIFFAGYLAFFNVDTKYCDDVSFSWWNHGHSMPGVPCDPKVKPCLSQELRRTADDLSIDVNRMLSAAVDRVNAEKSQKVHFIDPNHAFNGHRFCEVDNGKEVEEPKPSRADIWFFLSAWPDNKLDGGGIAALVDDTDPTLGNENTNTTVIPPSSAVYGNTESPRNYILCQIAQVNEHPELPEHQQLVHSKMKSELGISATATLNSGNSQYRPKSFIRGR